MEGLGRIHPGRAAGERSQRFTPDAIYHLHNRFNGLALVASLLGVPLFSDATMQGVLAAKLDCVAPTNDLQHGFKAAYDWYADTALAVGRDLPLTELFRFRADDDARQDFIRFLRAPHDLRATAVPEFQGDLRRRLDKAITAFNKLSSKSYQFKQVLLSGLISTLGRLVGGDIGALIGGLGAGPITFFFAKEYDFNRLEPWACYFAKWSTDRKR